MPYVTGYVTCAAWVPGQGELTQSTLGRENVQVHLCVYLNVNFRRAFWHEITKREFFKLKLINFREKFFCHVSRAQTGVILFHVSEHLRGNIVSILDLEGLDGISYITTWCLKNEQLFFADRCVRNKVFQVQRIFTVRNILNRPSQYLDQIFKDSICNTRM